MNENHVNTTPAPTTPLAALEGLLEGERLHPDAQQAGREILDVTYAAKALLDELPEAAPGSTLEARMATLDMALVALGVPDEDHSDTRCSFKNPPERWCRDCQDYAAQDAEPLVANA